MLKRYSALFSFFRRLTDILVIVGIWVAIYYVRYNSGLFSTAKGIAPIKYHLMLTLPVVSFCYLACLWSGLYKSVRIQSLLGQIANLLKATLLGGLLVLAFLYYVRDAPYSRKLLALFVVMLFLGLCLSHLAATTILRYLRKRGYNMRSYVVIGAGKIGQQVVQEIERSVWLGLKCLFFVDDRPNRIGRRINGIPVYGPFDHIPELFTNHVVDEVYLALSGSQAGSAYKYLEQLQMSGITVRIVPDWGKLITVSKATTFSVGSQLLFSAGDSPLTGTNILIKEIFDRTIALVMLTALAMPMVIIALLVKIFSKGPVFYKQIRIGVDQHKFKMIKFRTMRNDAEKDNQVGWSVKSDSRRTKIGTWLRKASLDELPQLINVLKGDMSLVGPRPERPYYVKEFSENYKNYMLRHKVKSGITGWAQINGYRGDTSLRKRLPFDFYSIRNWSIWFDIRILLMTPLHVLTGKNAY